MLRPARKFARVLKYLLVGVTVFCFTWIVCVNEWNSGVRLNIRRSVRESFSTVKTVVGYSDGAQAERDKPSPVACSRLPAYPEIPIINNTWAADSKPSTWQQVKGTSVSLYSAYYDERSPQRYVRILGMFRGRHFSAEEPLFCQTRSKNPNDAFVEVVAVKGLEMWWHEWDTISPVVETPVILSCPLTEPFNERAIVSVVKEPCDDPSNGFNIAPLGNKKYDRTFTICVKDMMFPNDISQNLIEWIETNKILGVEMIDMYIDEMSEKNMDVLVYYKMQGNVRLFQVPINKSSRSLWQRRRDHVISYNDCLYRNIFESKYIVPLDIDEILLPKKSYTWHGLLKRLKRKGWISSKYSAILIQNVFFFEFMQKYKYRKRHKSRKKRYNKRDDVRIYKEDNTIELVDFNNSFNNSVNNLNEYYEPREEFKSKCGVEVPVPKLASHVISSSFISPVGRYSKSIMLTRNVLTAFNHYPLANVRTSTLIHWSAPIKEVQINHYKDSCNTTLVAECEKYEHNARFDPSALHLRRRLIRALEKRFCAQINKS